MPRNNNPHFSVIIPVHNKAPTLRRAVDSVLTQSFADFELLLINDASTDDSPRIFLEYSDPRIRIFHRSRPGRGGYAARNLGVKEARARWLAFLDADDEWSPHHLRVLNGLAAEPGFDVICTGWTDSYREGQTQRNAFSAHHAQSDKIPLDFPGFLSEYLARRKPVWTGSLGVRRTLLHKVGGFPESCVRGGDTATWLRLISRSGGLLVSPQLTAIYHREDSHVTKLLPPEVRNSCIYRATREILDGIRERPIRKLVMGVCNLHVSAGLRARAVSGVLRFADCQEHFFLIDPGEHLLFRLHSLMPARVQSSVWRIYGRIKRLARR
jgi:glycosyltransferase involved in cell wall biosynthesis